MKIAIYSPYLDTVGGGERYMLTIAEILSKDNQVEVLLDTHIQTLDIESIKQKVSKLLNLNLSKMNFVKAPLGKRSSLWKRINFLKQYDLLFYLTDGSIFFSSARKNILHIQSPIKVTNTNLWKKLKSSSWNLIIYNSKFTRENCEKFWNIKGEVIYPPVDTKAFRASKKKKQILTVGRFFGFLKDKKHEIMINSFKKIVDSGKAESWSLTLVGGAQPGDLGYVNNLKELAKDYPIDILPNLPFEELKRIYSQSSIYWHAAGYGESDPTKQEHFGITTVEAMASGCVPVIINLGGQIEIIDEGENGFLWESPEELQTKTLKLINTPELMEKLSVKASKTVEKFSKEEFSKKIRDLLK